MSYWTESPGRRHDPWRQIFEFFICLAVAVLLYRTWYVQSFVVPSGSMAMTLVGLHRDLVCADCGYAYRVGTDDPLPPYTTCTNCGYPDNRVDDRQTINGDRLLVDKTVYSRRPPERFEVIVFWHPDESHKAYIKRAVGLPGETIEIRDGEVHADGRLVRKTLDQQRAMALLIHDDRFRPDESSGFPPRWLADLPQTGWQRDGDRYARAPESLRHAATSPRAATDAVDWLAYRHWQRTPGRSDQAAEAPIYDNCGYNPLVSRRLNHVSDLLLRCRLRTSGEGSLWWYATDGREQFVLEIAPARGLVRLEHNQREVRRAEVQRAILADWTTFELSTCDRQVIVACDGDELLEPYEYEPSAVPLQPTSRPLAVGTRQLGIELENLQLYRDVYYTRPANVASPWGFEVPYQLAADEYFVLGDNSPLSEDSRSWQSGPGVPRELLVGKPLFVHLPSRLLDWRSWRLQLPDHTRMRYVR